MKTQLQQCKGLHEVVKTLLEIREDLRENDCKLVANVWRNEIEQMLGEDALKRMTAHQFFAFYLSQEQISSSDSITRARRKIQQDNCNLRGNNYKERQTQEKTFRKEINK